MYLQGFFQMENGEATNDELNAVIALVVWVIVCIVLPFGLTLLTHRSRMRKRVDESDLETETCDE